MDPFSRALFSTRIGIFFVTLVEGILNAVNETFLFFGIAKFDSENIDDVSERGKVLMVEARARGWYMATMRISGKATDRFKLVTPNGRKHNFTSLPRLGGSVDMLIGWIDDKAVLKQFLSSHGVAVSKGGSFTNWEDVEKYFETVSGPLIVKPRLGSRGRHTTTHITTKEDLRKAFDIAKQLGRFVIVEEHLVGSVYRGTVIDGVLAGVLAGDPPRITGDGIHTISELIEQKNQTRHARVAAVKYTPELDIFLQRFNYTLDTVLATGTIIDLTEKVGLSYGGNARDVTPITHPKLRLELERAAKVIKDPFLGFDFITTDVSADPDITKWGIIECNTVPFINLHHHPLEGESINVAKMVLDYLERNTNLS
jgi:D-alanine-D-alanine ligase-like ATP-grasp enzyme